MSAERASGIYSNKVFSFWAVNKDGSGRQSLGANILCDLGSEFHTAGFAVDGGWVYYAEDRSAENKPGVLSKIRLDGTDKTVLDATPGTWPQGPICLDSGWVYYTPGQYDDGRNSYVTWPETPVFRIRVDGTGRMAVGENGAQDYAALDARADAALAEYGLARTAFGIQSLHLHYEGDARAVAVSAVSVEGEGALDIEPLDVSQSGFLGGASAGADWMRDPANFGKTYTASARLTITLADGSSVEFTDVFPFRLESGM